MNSLLTYVEHISQDDGKNYGGKALGLMDLFLGGFTIPKTAFCPYALYKKCTIPELSDSIVKSFTFPFIIRSSANHEDGNTYSFAGMFSSFVCHNTDNLIAALHFFYNFQAPASINLYYKGDDIFLNLIIQEYINPEYSGVYVSRYIGGSDGYGEYLEGHLSLLVQDDIDSCNFIFHNHSIESTTMNKSLKESLGGALKKLDITFSGKYEYEWLSIAGNIIFVQKRPFLGNSILKST